MQPTDFKTVLTDVIKKQMVVLGPDITLAKVRSVAGVTCSDDGTVTDVTSDPKQITQELMDAFTDLAGTVIHKTMEPLLSFQTATPTTQDLPVNLEPTVPVSPTPNPTPTLQSPEPTLQTPSDPMPITPPASTIQPTTPAAPAENLSPVEEHLPEMPKPDAIGLTTAPVNSMNTPTEQTPSAMPPVTPEPFVQTQGEPPVANVDLKVDSQELTKPQ